MTYVTNSFLKHPVVYTKEYGGEFMGQKLKIKSEEKKHRMKRQGRSI
jgi:hypothetical protein